MHRLYFYHRLTLQNLIFEGNCYTILRMLIQYNFIYNKGVLPNLAVEQNETAPSLSTLSLGWELSAMKL
jgi:hypothetical protein